VSKYSDSVKAIKSNYPPEQYTQLREALDLSIRLLNKEDNKETDVQMKHVILNGDPDPKTLDEYVDKEWIPLLISKANNFHPYAMETDTILFLAKPINKEKHDQWMSESRVDDSIKSDEKYLIQNNGPQMSD
jgi:hypothetical protein